MSINDTEKVASKTPLLGRSTRYALALSLGFVVFIAGYIVLSGWVAARLAVSVERLAQVEMAKGLVSAVTCGIALFVASRAVLNRFERSTQELRRREQALVANDRRIVNGLMASSVAHDANNVLHMLLMGLDRLAQGHNAEQVARLRALVEQLGGLNKRMLQTARKDVPDADDTIDAAKAVNEAVALVRAHERVQGCTVRVEAKTNASLKGHPILVQQLVTNLVMNAADATKGHGTVLVRLEQASDALELEVHDDGPGVPMARRQHLFDALETTKEQGHGLGLFSVKACAQGMGGSVEVLDSNLGGACFRVRLPLAEAGALAV